jgi:phospholipid/cholesterol/gamma-HCH transport system permease protein
MAVGSATATLKASDEELVTTLTGDWRLEETTPEFDALIATNASNAAAAPRVLAFDATALGEWDSSLLVFLRQAQVYSVAQDSEFRSEGLPPHIAQLLALASAVPERITAPNERPVSRVAAVGLAGLSVWDAVLASLRFVGEVAEGLFRLVTGKTRMQWRTFWVVVQSNSSGALPIVSLIALLVGVIIAFLGAVVLQRFGAGYYVSYLVGYGMLREMGALMTGIILAGRTGAGFAAELGSMKITEELDAYATLGIPAVDYLVLPRMLGLFVMMPLLVLYADAVGILGGMIVAVALVDLTPTQFITGMLTAVALPDALLGVVKGAVYGLLIGFAGCFHGLRTGNDASAVGRSATSAVVLGITLIIVANAIIDWLAALWKI